MRALLQLQAELESSPLVTVLVPSKRSDRRESDMIRVNVSQPPSWYRSLCGRHPSSRGVRRGRFDTRVKRANVLQLLDTLIRHGHSRSKYAGEILRVARGITA
jgi:hypothetical protein